MQGFLEALDERVLVCDGAMGTMLYAKGVFLNRSFDELNLTQPELVAEIHREYLRAGADVLETNTFGANRFKLAQFGAADEVGAINREGARIARRVAQDKAWVAGSIGPLGLRIEPWGRTSVADAEAAFRDQASALAEGGVDLFILETFRDITELTAAIRGVRAASPLPIVAQLTTGEDGHTLDGTPAETFVPELERAGPDVIGVNCSVGPAAMLETIESIARLTSARLAAQPNAGRPRDVDGRHLYLSSPDYMASYARRFIAAGVRLVGGCCGTTPEHTRQIVKAVRSSAPGSRPAPSVTADAPVAPVPLVARREKSALARALADGQFAVVVEIGAPRGADLAPAIEQAQRFHDQGAVAVNVPDYAKSGARASALTLAALVQRSGVETLLHYTCRDRTLIGMQSDLVSAHALGIQDVLLTTGSVSPLGTYPEAGSAFEVDAVGLMNMATRLNQGLDIAGQPLGTATRFHLGAAVNPFAADPDAEWRRLDYKVAAGAEFLMTPPVLDLEAFEPALRRMQATGLPVIAGVAALQGLRHAEFLASEVIGVRVSDATLGRLRAARDDEDEAAVMTAEIVGWLKARAQGIVITWLHGSPSTVERLLPSVGSPPSARRQGSAA